MSYIINLKVETVDAKRRDALMEPLFDALMEHAKGADSATIKIEREGKTARGKRKITDTVEWMIAVEPPPLITDFGLVEERPLERELRLSGADAANGKSVRSA